MRVHPPASALIDAFLTRAEAERLRIEFPPEDFGIMGKPVTGLVIVPKKLSIEAWNKFQQELAKIYEPQCVDPQATDYEIWLSEREQYNQKVRALYSKLHNVDVTTVFT